MTTTGTWHDLSDGELKSRLLEKTAWGEFVVAVLVRQRDDEGTAELITMALKEE